MERSDTFTQADLDGLIHASYQAELVMNYLHEMHDNLQAALSVITLGPQRGGLGMLCKCFTLLVTEEEPDMCDGYTFNLTEEGLGILQKFFPHNIAQHAFTSLQFIEGAVVSMRTMFDVQLSRYATCLVALAAGGLDKSLPMSALHEKVKPWWRDASVHGDRVEQIQGIVDKFFPVSE